MTLISRHFIIAVSLALTIAACDTKEGDKKGDAIVAVDDSSSRGKILSTPATISLENRVIDSKTLMEKKGLANARRLSASEFNVLSILSLDSEAGSAGYTFHLVDTLFKDAATKIYLLGRAYGEENICWLACYDENSNLLDFQKVYYDNSEGALSIESQIKDNRIIVTTINEYGETEAEKKKTDTFWFDESRKLVRK